MPSSPSPERAAAGARLADTAFSLQVSLGYRDAYTRSHCTRVAAIAMLLGQHCGLSAADLDLLRTSADLHDIGKIGLSDAVLLKPGPLDAAEWAEVKRHPVIGQQICESLAHEDAARIGRIVRHHHEAFDGSGYPDGLLGDDIPVLARVIAVADSYDAMTTRRVYQAARPHGQALGIMQSQAGGRFDPHILDRFVRMAATSSFAAYRPRT